MQHFARRAGATLAALLALSLAACGDESPKIQPVFPVMQGIQHGLSLASLVDQGWDVCYQDAYSGGAVLDDVLAGCQGRYMMLACAESAATDTLALAAADTRAVVTTPDGSGQHRVANGVGWYHNDNLSWGFFPAGQAIDLSPCDPDAAGQAGRADRLCWHTADGSLTAGYRCGGNDLTASATWRRLVLVHP